MRRIVGLRCWRTACAAAAALTASVFLLRCSSDAPSAAPDRPAAEPLILSPQLAEVREVDRAAVPLAERARQATVCLVFVDLENGRRGTGSGAIVQSDAERALVLTCGHLTREKGRTCRVVLADGRLLEGEVLASVQRDGIDLGLVECRVEDGPLPTIPLATELPAEGDWVMVLGHPRGLWLDASPEPGAGDERSGGAPEAETGSDASLPRWGTARGQREFDDESSRLDRRGRPAIVRSGRIWSEPGAGLGVRFDAPIDSGDSGGPVLDLQGRLVGIASRCGWKSHWNWASSIFPLQGDPRRMADESMEWPDGLRDAGLGSGDPRPPARSRMNPDYLAGLRSPATAAVSRSVALVESEGGPRAFAVAVAPDAFVTKGSEAGFVGPIDLVVGERRVRARRAAYDPDADLLLLRAPGLGLAPLAIGPDAPAARAGMQLLSVAPGGEVLAVGTCSLEPFRAEDVDARPFLGVSTRANQGGGVTIRSITPGTAAARSGLEVGDLVRTVNGVEVGPDRMLPSIIASRQVGDSIHMVVERDGRPRSVEVALGRRTPGMRERDRGNTRLATSAVLPYRVEIFQHDGAIEPHECGAPLVDLQGRVVGVSVARFDRTSTWAMPAEEFARRARALLESPEAPASRMQAYADAGLVATERRDRLQFPAPDARTVGPRQLRRAIGELRAVDGSGFSVMQDDRLEWEFELSRGGRFEVLYFGSSSGDHLVRLEVDGAAHEADLPEGNHPRGTTLGEVEIEGGGRHRLAFEWSAVQGQLPGNLERLELRRLDRQKGSDDSGEDSATGPARVP